MTTVREVINDAFEGKYFRDHRYNRNRVIEVIEQDGRLGVLPTRDDILRIAQGENGPSWYAAGMDIADDLIAAGYARESPPHRGIRTKGAEG